MTRILRPIVSKVDLEVILLLEVVGTLKSQNSLLPSHWHTFKFALLAVLKIGMLLIFPTPNQPLPYIAVRQIFTNVESVKILKDC
jgi:hypothetical protein